MEKLTDILEDLVDMKELALYIRVKMEEKIDLEDLAEEWVDRNEEGIREHILGQMDEKFLDLPF